MYILYTLHVFMLFKKSNKVFIHVDCDSFFASCEVLRNPSLQWKFVCVWQEIIIACTYNCKKLGIKTGTPIWEAKRILKDWVFLYPQHGYYEEISQKVFSYLENTTLSIEPFSIDEAFCEITGLPEMHKLSLWQFLRNMQKWIMEDIGVPVSIGCANTRIKAKIYSKINKPFWIYIWFDEKKEVALFKKLEISKIPFIWKAYTEKLKYQASTIYSFVQIWFWQLKKDIWKSATDLWLELVWVNVFVVKKSKEVKSISRSRSFNNNITNNSSFLLEQLSLHFERVFEDIISKNFEIKSLSIFFRTKSFQVLTYEYVFPEHTNNRKILYEATLALFKSHFDESLLYRSIGIIFGNFRSYLPRQTNIFDTVLRWKESNYKLYKVLESINEKYSTHKVCFWTTLLEEWKDAKCLIRK